MSHCTDRCLRPTPFQAHCSNEETQLFHLAKRDGNTFLGPGFYTESTDGPPDTSGVLAKKFANLRGAKSGFIKSSGFRYPRGTVDGVVLPRRDWSEVLFTVVSSVPVMVVNMLFSSDPLTHDSMFVGLDVTTQTHLPSKSDVPVIGEVSAGRVTRYLLTGKKLANEVSVASALLAGGTVPFLGSTNDLDPAGNTGLPHDAILQVKTLCHRTFGGVKGFDRHRVNGHCIDPGAFGHVERDGIWREPMDHNKVAMFRARVEGKR